MALTPQNLIDDAKLQAWPFLREEDISPAALLRQLTSLDREVVGLIAAQYPERISVQATDVTIVLATNATGYTLSAAKNYSNFVHVSASSGERLPIEIVPEGKEPSKHPAAYIYGVTFLPIDQYERDWDTSLGDRLFFLSGDKVEYRYIPEPGRVTTMSQTLASPDEAESYFREALTLSILLNSGASPERIQVATQLMAQKRQLLQHEINKRTGVSARYGE